MRNYRSPVEGGRGGRERGGGEGAGGPPNRPNVTPVSSSPTSCHLPNAPGFIFLIDTSLPDSISIFRLSFCLHHSSLLGWSVHVSSSPACPSRISFGVFPRPCPPHAGVLPPFSWRWLLKHQAALWRLHSFPLSADGGNVLALRKFPNTNPGGGGIL